MDFQIWKVNIGKGEDAPRFTFSIRAGENNPVILDQYKFTSLFPGIDPDSVPTAPLTRPIKVEATLK